MQSKLIEFLYQNIIAFLVIVFITFINGQSYINGNIIWLPIGAVSLCYLLFGFRVFVAVFFGITASSLWFHDQTFNGINMLHLVGTFAPLLAIASMKFFKLSNFFDGGKVIFQHLLFVNQNNKILQIDTESQYQDLVGLKLLDYDFSKRHLINQYTKSLLD